ncbi:MAG: hypothetical protein V7K89_00285 [Nostoc sp.]
MSIHKRVTLGDGGNNEHTIVFLRARRQRLFALNSELAQSPTHSNGFDLQ